MIYEYWRPFEFFPKWLYYSCIFHYFSLTFFLCSVCLFHALSFKWSKIAKVSAEQNINNSIVAVFSTSIKIKNIVYVKLSIFLTCPTSSWLSAKKYFSLKGLVLNSTEFRFPMQALSFEVWYLRWNPWFKVSKARRFRKMADSIPGHQSFNPNLAYHLFLTCRTWISGLIHENRQ